MSEKGLTLQELQKEQFRDQDGKPLDRKLTICVAGWYFYPELMKQLGKVHQKYRVTLLTDVRRARECQKTFDDTIYGEDFYHYEIPLASLEWPKYDHYIKNIWLRGPVLFMHDDIKIHDLVFFDKIANLKCDQAFVFQNEEKAGHNQHFHGRGIFCSEQFIRAMLEYRCTCKEIYDRPAVHHNKGTNLPGHGPHKGFWFDPFNDMGGNERHATGPVPVGLRHYNDGIYHFAMFAKRMKSGHRMPGGEIIKMDSDCKVHFEEFEHGKRGVLQK